jgi:raffinose/stachyose/melibiose transport system permease protein
VSIPIFIMTNFLQTIPDAMRESAKIDGAGELLIFIKIILPMMKPVIGALIPLSAASLWNDFFIPLVFLSTGRLKTVPLGLMLYFNGKGFDNSKIGIVFAAVSFSILPLLLIYLFGSRKIIDGLTQGTIK